MEKEVIFHEFDFETSSLELEVSKSTIQTHTTSYDKGVFINTVYKTNKITIVLETVDVIEAITHVASTSRLATSPHGVTFHVVSQVRCDVTCVIDVFWFA